MKQLNSLYFTDALSLLMIDLTVSLLMVHFYPGKNVQTPSLYHFMVGDAKQNVRPHAKFLVMPSATGKDENTQGQEEQRSTQQKCHI